VRRKKENPGVATYDEVWSGLKSDLRKAPRGIMELIFSLDTYLLLACLVGVSTIYYVGTALLFSYLPGRLYGAAKQSWVWDTLLGLLLATIAGLVIRGKVKHRQETKKKARREAKLKEELGMEKCRLQAQVLAKLAEKGRLHPETGYAYQALGKTLEALGESEQARQAYQQGRDIFRETLGAAHPEANYFGVIEKEKVVIQPRPEVVPTNPGVYDGPEIFDTRRVLASIFGIFLALSVMSVVIIGFAHVLKALFSLFQ